jgi:hypothetical protein
VQLAGGLLHSNTASGSQMTAKPAVVVEFESSDCRGLCSVGDAVWVAGRDGSVLAYDAQVRPPKCAERAQFMDVTAQSGRLLRTIIQGAHSLQAVKAYAVSIIQHGAASGSCRGTRESSLLVAGGAVWLGFSDGSLRIYDAEGTLLLSNQDHTGTCFSTHALPHSR